MRFRLHSSIANTPLTHVCCVYKHPCNPCRVPAPAQHESAHASWVCDFCVRQGVRVAGLEIFALIAATRHQHRKTKCVTIPAVHDTQRLIYEQTLRTGEFRHSTRTGECNIFSEIYSNTSIPSDESTICISHRANERAHARTHSNHACPRSNKSLFKYGVHASK